MERHTKVDHLSLALIPKAVAPTEDKNSSQVWSFIKKKKSPRHYLRQLVPVVTGLILKTRRNGGFDGDYFLWWTVHVSWG